MRHPNVRRTSDRKGPGNGSEQNILAVFLLKADVEAVGGGKRAVLYPSVR